MRVRAEQVSAFDTDRAIAKRCPFSGAGNNSDMLRQTVRPFLARSQMALDLPCHQGMARFGQVLVILQLRLSECFKRWRKIKNRYA